MPYFDDGYRDLYFELFGPENAPAILLLARGGMESTISLWNNGPWNPIEQLKTNFRIVAMDQRNAGRSTAPVSSTDNWQTYTDDQLALMSYLGAEHFHVAGMCIGGPFALGLLQSAPTRILSATIFQTIGRDRNQAVFYNMFDEWAKNLIPKFNISPDEWTAFRENMFGGSKHLFNVDESFIKTIITPMLVLEGNDEFHPKSSSELLRDNAQEVTYLSQWQQGFDRDKAISTFMAFLQKHS